MTFRSFTPLATRKSPQFRGRSLFLDGVGDYIDLQGKSSPAFWKNSRTRQPTSGYFRPASWSMWVKFPQTQINAVGNAHALGNDMETFIVAEASADQGPTTDLHSSNFAGLVSDDGTNAYLAVGWGKESASQSQYNRAIRHGNTSILADTWYHFAWTYAGRANSPGNDWDMGITMWVNGTSQTLSYYVPSGVSEMNPANCSTRNDAQSGGAQSDFDFLHAYIGRNGSFYTSMHIAQAAFWEGLDLDNTSVTALYGGGTPPADITSNFGESYKKGTITGAKITVNFTGIGAGQTLRISDHFGLQKNYSLTTQDSTGTVIGSGGLSGNTAVDVGAVGATKITAAEEFAKAVNGADSGHGYPSGASGTQGFQTVYADWPGEQGSSSVTLELGIGGETPITSYSTGLGQSFLEDISSWTSVTSSPTFTNSTAAFDVSSAQGIGRGVRSGLAGWWKFDGPGIDTTVSALQSTPKRVDNSNEFPPAQASNQLFANSIMVCKPAINNGGTYTTDHPGS
tara:strand:- start:455 stop:1987 length:1533 start_codon:yes stop_codon:yes gene_type:complete